MYYDYFGLSGPPFSLDPAPEMLHLGPAHREALAALEWGLSEPSGFTLLIGEAGAGKTTLVRTLLSRHRDDLHALCIDHPTITFEEILGLLLQELRAKPGEAGKVEMLQALKTFEEMLGVLLQELRAKPGEPGKLEMLEALKGALSALGPDERVALIIDEAQALRDEVLEELRLLGNLRGGDERRKLQIIFVGQPDLLRRLSTPGLSQLNQRIGARALLPALSPAEATEYIAHRLRMKGREVHDLMQRKAIKRIARYSRGNPRRICQLCHNSLMLAFAAGAGRVTPAMARQAAAEYEDLLGERKQSARRASGYPQSGWARFRAGVTLACAASFLAGAGFYQSPAAKKLVCYVRSRYAWANALYPQSAVKKTAGSADLPASSAPAPRLPSPGRVAFAAGAAASAPVVQNQTNQDQANMTTPGDRPVMGARPDGTEETLTVRLPASGPAENNGAIAAHAAAPGEKARGVANLAAIGSNGPAISPSHTDAVSSATRAQPQAQNAAHKPQAVKVKPGDTLTKIAQRELGPDLAVGLRKLILANPQIRNANRIYPGDTLRLPESGKSAVKE